MAGDEYAPCAERKSVGGAMLSITPRSGGASGRIGKPSLVDGPFAPSKVDVMPNHHLD
jgi:hypothetical protein